MKVQNQVRVWSVGQRTSSWHITDMWDRSVSKPISIDGKMANPPFLERDEEREHTDGLARRPRYIRAWLIDIIITCWTALFCPSFANGAYEFSVMFCVVKLSSFG